MDECNKCGSGRIGLEYQELTDRVQCTCDKCGYVWQEDPLDKHPRDVLAGDDKV